MPRKKTVQPEPIDTWTLDDGTIVEVRDDGSFEIGKGLHMKDKYDLWFSEVLKWVAEQYLTPEGRKVIADKDDILKSASIFDRALQGSPLYPLSGDDSSVRTRLYPDIVSHIRALEKAIAENNKNTP